MISVAYPRNRNSDTLQCFTTFSPILAPLIPILRECYVKYRINRGNPRLVFPLNHTNPGTISALQETALHALYRTTYKKLKEDYRKLDWAYDLRKSADLPYCPMCGNTGRDALDHYLAKADYPEYSVFTFNLVPTCTACNSKRGNNANQAGSALALIHPYFEGSKLNAPLVHVDIQGDDSGLVPPTFEIPSFKLVPTLPPNDPLYNRLDNHLTKCVDSTQLTRWVMGRWKSWRIKAFKYDSTVALCTAIADELDAEVKVGGTNNWTAAFLRGLLRTPLALEWLRNNPI